VYFFLSFIFVKQTQASDEMNLTLYSQPIKMRNKKNYTLEQLEKPLLQTSGRLKIIQIKKYIIQQLKLDSISPDSVRFSFQFFIFILFLYLVTLCDVGQGLYI
jgi:hypothetical protein